MSTAQLFSVNGHMNFFKFFVVIHCLRLAFIGVGFHFPWVDTLEWNYQSLILFVNLQFRPHFMGSSSLLMQGQLEHLEPWSALRLSLSGGSLTFYLVVGDLVVRASSGADTHNAYMWSPFEGSWLLWSMVTGSKKRCSRRTKQRAVTFLLPTQKL